MNRCQVSGMRVWNKEGTQLQDVVNKRLDRQPGSTRLHRPQDPPSLVLRTVQLHRSILPGSRKSEITDRTPYLPLKGMLPSSRREGKAVDCPAAGYASVLLMTRAEVCSHSLSPVAAVEEPSESVCPGLRHVCAGVPRLPQFHWATIGWRVDMGSTLCGSRPGSLPEGMIRGVACAVLFLTASTVTAPPQCLLPLPTGQSGCV